MRGLDAKWEDLMTNERTWWPMRGLSEQSEDIYFNMCKIWCVYQQYDLSVTSFARHCANKYSIWCMNLTLNTNRKLLNIYTNLKLFVVVYILLLHLPFWLRQEPNKCWCMFVRLAQTCLEHSIFIILGQIFKHLSKSLKGVFKGSSMCLQKVFNVSSRGLQAL